MPKKVIPNSERVKIVLSSFQDKVIVTKLCAKHGIPRSTFYRWRKLILVGLSALMSGNKRPSRGQDTSRARKQRYRCRLK